MKRRTSKNKKKNNADDRASKKPKSQPPNQEQFREACSQGDERLVKLFLARPENDPAADDNEAVHSANECGHVKIVDMLFEDDRVSSNALDERYRYKRMQGCGLLDGNTKEDAREILKGELPSDSEEKELALAKRANFVKTLDISDRHFDDSDGDLECRCDVCADNDPVCETGECPCERGTGSNETCAESYAIYEGFYCQACHEKAMRNGACVECMRPLTKEGYCIWASPEDGVWHLDGIERFWERITRKPPGFFSGWQK